MAAAPGAEILAAVLLGGAGIDDADFGIVQMLEDVEQVGYRRVVNIVKIWRLPIFLEESY